MKRFKLFVALAVTVFAPAIVCAQGGAATNIRSSAEPLPNCTPASGVQAEPMIWDTTAGVMKVCTATNTWTTVSGSGSGLVIVDGRIYPRTDVGINAAITACPAGGTVLMSNGAYSIAGTINIAKPLNLIGTGKGSQLIVSAALGATTDIILVQPASDGNYIRLTDFVIVPASGSPGRHAIHLNGASAEVNNFTMERVLIPVKFGGNAVFADGSGLGQGTPVVATIGPNNVLVGGVVMPNAGDTVRIINNVISGAGPAIDVTFQPGAASFILSGNNITSDGGTHIGNYANTTQILNNEFETDSTFTGSNGSVIDLDASSTAAATGPNVTGNGISVINGITANGIRVNYSLSANISANRLTRGISTSKDILITSNALQTQIGVNMFTTGGPLSSEISDSGTGTIITGKVPVQVVTSTAFNFGTYLNGYAVCEDSTAAAVCAGTLPTAAAGIQYCVSNGYNGSNPNTGVVAIGTSAAGQFIIDMTGALSASGGYVSSGGAARDSACVVGVDSTHWLLYVKSGTWTTH
jgi:hypothetical protein